jgi:hypothetical protein
MTNSTRLGQTARFARLARSCGDSDQGIQIGKLAENQKIRLIEGGGINPKPKDES